MLQAIRNYFCRPHDNLSVSDKLVLYAERERNNAEYNLADYILGVREHREIFHSEVLQSLQGQFRDLKIFHKLLQARKELGSSALEPDDRRFLREHLHLLRPVERRTSREPGPRPPRQDETAGPDGQRTTEEPRLKVPVPPIPYNHIMGRYR
jgi:hypothetical protein